jgi:hypothetical protein
MAGYTPGEQPKPGERVIKLNTNENPFPPSPRVVDAIRRITPDALRRYPSSMADEFRAVAARVHGVSPESILAGNGSDDILQVALRSYCGPGDVLVCPDPTYSLYPVLADSAADDGLTGLTAPVTIDPPKRRYRSAASAVAVESEGKFCERRTGRRALRQSGRLRPRACRFYDREMEIDLRKRATKFGLPSG